MWDENIGLLPLWLVISADVSLVGGIISALFVIYDIFIADHHQKMKIMDVVWPITAFYFGIFGIIPYWKLAERSKLEHQQERATQHEQLQQHSGQMSHQQMQGSQHFEKTTPDIGGSSSKQSQKRANEGQQSSSPDSHTMQMQKRPFWQYAFTSTTHCGAGCTLGDVVGEFAIFFLGLHIFGTLLIPELTTDYVLAYVLGIFFQFFAIVPMRHLRTKEGIKQAIKADTLSLTTFEIGLFAWMAFFALVLFAHSPIHPDSTVYWFMMQIGMLIGFLTSYPANWLLVKKGIKEKM